MSTPQDPAGVSERSAPLSSSAASGAARRRAPALAGHILTQPCMACNRETGQPMCPLCSDLEDAEDAARDNERRPDDD